MVARKPIGELPFDPSGCYFLGAVIILWVSWCQESASRERVAIDYTGTGSQGQHHPRQSGMWDVDEFLAEISP